MNDAIARNGNLPKVKVVAILNDTTGTLVKGSYDDADTCIGLILGTGCNGAYFEDAAKVIRWNSESDNKDHKGQHVIIDPEFGAFGDNGCIDFIKSEFDVAVDKASLLPGSFTFEKYFAGKYAGEIARRILVKLQAENCFLSGKSVLKLNETESFTAENLSQVSDATEEDCAVLSYVCEALTERCAFLVGVVLAVLLNRMARKERNSAIAVTGSLYKGHPNLKRKLEKYVHKYSNDGIKSYTFLSDDGSGKGAGLVAAIAKRLEDEKVA